MANYIKSFNFRNGVQVDNDNFIVNAAGRVGIGTTVPDKILDVRGNAKVVGHITATDASVSGIVTVGSITINGNTGTISATNFSGSGGNFGDAPVVAIATAGFILGPTGLTTTTSIGIGTNITEFQLQVGGNPSSSVGFGVTNGNVSASGDLIISGISSLSNTTATNLTAQQLRVIGVSTVGSLKVGSGIIASNGIITATTFNGNLIGNVTGNLNSTGVSTVGTLKVGTGITAEAGIITASSFVGDGSSLTGITTTQIVGYDAGGGPSGVGTDGSINTTGIITATAIISSGIGSFNSIGIQTSAPSTDLQIRKTSGDAILEVISDTGKSSIRIGKNTGAGTSSASINYGSTSGFGDFSTPKSFDIINNDVGNVNYFLSNSALTESGFIWHRGSVNQLMTLTRAGNLGIGITNPTHKLNVQGISTFTGAAHFGTNVNIVGSLSVPTISNNVNFTGDVSFNNGANVNGIVTATSFSGTVPSSSLSGALPALDGSALTGIVGTGSGVVVKNNGSPVGTAATIDFSTGFTVSTISAGIVTLTATSSGGLSDFATNAGIATYADNAGIATVATYADNAGVSTVAGIATYTSEWTLGNNGTSHYTFTGPGLTGAENDPVIYLVRGQQYKFTNTMNAHPFRIQSTLNGSTGTQYDDGIVNNNIQNGTLTWNVQFDAPSTLYYQCTSHANMGGVIRILDAVTTNSSVTDVITISSSTDVLSAVDPGADRLVFWDETQNKLSYLTVGSNLTIDNDTISASGEGGALQSRTVVSGNTSSIINNATGNVDITGFKSYALMKVGLSTAGWIKLYTDSTSRSNDASRSVGEDPTPGSGVIAEVVTTGISTQQNISPFVIGGNMNDPADSTIYVSITNLSGTTQVITANLTILQLEQ